MLYLIRNKNNKLKNLIIVALYPQTYEGYDNDRGNLWLQTYQKTSKRWR